ncbi:MAG: hypothetical protein K2K70_11385, partial [Lachnospiraceae bacterium]|nr:hypothetical protein [Lachnospiraceae bacterium]
LLTEEFGADAITKILTGNDGDLLEQWKNSYISTLADIDMESQGYISNMTEQIASLYGVDLSPLQDQFQGVSDSVSGMTDALSEAANAIGIGNVSDNADSPNAPEGTSAPSTGTGSSLESAIKSETDTAMASFDQHTDKLTNEVIPAIQSATAEMIAFNEAADMDIEKTVTISYAAMGDKSSGGENTGKAYAEGTTGKAFANGNTGLKRNEKNALRSEYGQPELTVYPDGTTELTTQPVMSDLPKGTVIYNEEQTKKIMSNKPHTRGKTYANGTAEYSDGTIITPEGHTLRPLQPGDRGWELQKAFEPLLQKMSGNLDYLAGNAMLEHQRQMEQMINQLSTTNVVTNNRNIQPGINVGDIHITCPGVTSREVMREVGNALDAKFRGFHNYADQQSRIR